MQICDDIIHSFIYCQYKAYLIHRKQNGIITDYQTLYNHLKQNQKTCVEKILSENKILTCTNSTFDNKISNEGIFLNLKFTNANINLILDGIEFSSNKSIIPIFITPFENNTKYDKLFITMQSYYIQYEFGIHTDSCKIIYGKHLKQSKFKLLLSAKSIKKSVDELYKIISDSVVPSLALNNHCIICEYCSFCVEKAKADDNLSLLDRATDKIIEKYKKKGIFTIQQLSYQYKSRRRKKQRAKQLISHNIELQALAIRIDKILIQSLPELLRQPIELFIDIEGNPDLESYYLIGLLVAKNQETVSYSYWADNETDEINIWQQFLSKIDEYPNSFIFHYGNYDSKAIETLGKKYNTSITLIQPRLINISNSIFGKIYFPVYSNRLKDLGNYIGATWTSKNASGIQSLVWRYLWAETQDEGLKQVLITYNLEDCYALKMLTDKLSQIQESSSILPEIDFVNNPKKTSSPVSYQIHQQFDNILKFAHENYDSSKISFQSEDSPENKVGGKIGHKGVNRAIPKANRIIIVPRKRVCPKHNIKLSESTRQMAVTTLTNLVFTKNTIRKTVIQYTGYKGYCCKCKQDYSPLFIDKIRHQHFGHSFKSWIVYQRLVLRLPYDVIKLNLKEMFNETVSQSTVAAILMDFSSLYKYTNIKHLSYILKSPFIHVDETQVNIKGINNYVWIFTDGKYVFFQITETREIKIVQELLATYNGVLISDFYSGYDSIKCRHQKCWVHLIRDINDDLWKNPYDSEYERFVIELRNLITPIFASIGRYGSKKRHFNKFNKNLEAFYNKIVLDDCFNSEITLKYQTRLKKHWTNLFIFLEFDDIPWNNNMAERGLRHLAVQRKISTHFNNGIDDYLLFLGIMQTCRFQKKSFFKFLLSGKKNI